jgi:hypothetical protein
MHANFPRTGLPRTGAELGGIKSDILGGQATLSKGSREACVA